MHHNVRQNNLSVDRYDDLWIGCWSLKRQYNFGGDFDLHHLNLNKERQKSWASHLSIKLASDGGSKSSDRKEKFATPLLV